MITPNGTENVSKWIRITSLSKRNQENLALSEREREEEKFGNLTLDLMNHGIAQDVDKVNKTVKK